MFSSVFSSLSPGHRLESRGTAPTAAQHQGPHQQSSGFSRTSPGTPFIPMTHLLIPRRWVLPTKLWSELWMWSSQVMTCAPMRQQGGCLWVEPVWSTYLALQSPLPGFATHHLCLGQVARVAQRYRHTESRLQELNSGSQRLPWRLLGKLTA